MLTLVLSRIALNKANVSTYFISIISEINEFTNFVIWVRLMGGKDCDNRVSAYAIKGSCITGNNAFQCMVLHNIFFE